MGATGYTIKGLCGGSDEPVKTYNVVPADGTIDVERTEAENEVTFAIKTTYDGYETIEGGSPSGGGYYKAVHVKFNAETRRYRLVCILNGGSYTPVARDFAIYYIKMGYKTGGANSDHWYIQEYSRVGNGSYVKLEQISKTEYNILIHTPEGYAYANIGVLKEDKEPDVLIEHFNFNRTRYTPTGTLITTDVPTWRNGAPAVWQVIPDIVNPVAGMLGHYYDADRNLYFFDGTNWHLVYSLAQGVAQCLATTDAPATANDGSIYYDTTEGNLKIWQNGGWINIQKKINIPVRNEVINPKDGDICLGGAYNYTAIAYIYYSNTWKKITGVAQDVVYQNTLSSPPSYTGIAVFETSSRKFYIGLSGKWFDTMGNEYGTGPKIISQVVTFTNYSGETITAKDKPKIVVTASFGATSILDFSSIAKEEGKTIEITILSGSIIRVKDGATELDLNGCNESIVKAVCLSNTWHYYKTSAITEIV